MIYVLDNKIQEYQWGSKDFIPQLLNTTADENPKAELWMGAHPKAPSKIHYKDEQITLLDLIKTDPETNLGPAVAHRYNDQLPFLFKVLSSSNPLSIQAHPDLKQAREGFLKENQLGIPIDSFKRNYKDNDHKPELICALTEFDAMCGFQPINKIIDRVKYLKLQDVLLYRTQDNKEKSEAAFKQMFLSLMKMDKNPQEELVHKIVNTIENSSPRNDNESMIFYWIKKFAAIYPGDIGVISPLYLNVIKLQPGQALYLEAGTLHAYLNGSGIELMANSDNVLRGGLTPKNVDVPELMKILRFKHEKVKVLLPDKISECESIYKTTANEFQLSVIELDGKYDVKDIKGPEIILCVEGDTQIDNINLSKGRSVFIPCYEKNYRIKGMGRLFRAQVPSH